MADERTRVVLRITGDSRLSGAIAAAVGHFADRAGLDATAKADLTVAAEGACRETLPLPAKNATLGVTIAGFADRIEVTLERAGQSVLRAGSMTFLIRGANAIGAGGQSAEAMLSRVDRVQYARRGTTSRMTLVKFTRTPMRREK